MSSIKTSITCIYGFSLACLYHKFVTVSILCVCVYQLEYKKTWTKMLHYKERQR